MVYIHHMVQGLSQQWEAYELHHHQTWEKLYGRQRKNLTGKASTFFDLLDKMQDSLTSNLVPRVDAMEEELHTATGWRLKVVPGLIPFRIFRVVGGQEILHLHLVRQPTSSITSRSLTCSMTRLDTFLLAEPDFAAFMNRFGEIGVALIRAGHDDAVLRLQRLYWYVVEFGFLKNSEGEAKLLGAGIMSSFGETEYAWSRRFKLKQFELSRVMETSFRTDEIQQEYFVLNDLVQLRLELNGWFDQFNLSHG